MKLVEWLMGTIRVEIVSADVTGMLYVINGAGILLRNIEMPDMLTVQFDMNRKDWNPLAKLIRRRGEQMRILRRSGLWWKAAGLKRRPTLTMGLGLLTALVMFLPSRILLVEVEGNATIPANQILETAADCGIAFGASRRSVRSERVKNALLEAMPGLSWAGVNTYGSRAVITVREREMQPQEGIAPEISSIVATRDGFILSCQTERGSQKCIPGQTVRAGDVLISGYTDCGLCVTATRASGEVMAVTTRSLTVVTPAECMKKTGQTIKKVTYSLIVGKNRFNFYKSSGISQGSCGRMVTEYNLNLPGGFPLPVKLLRHSHIFAATEPAALDETLVAELLTEFAQGYLAQQMIAGTVAEAMETIWVDEDRWILTGNYACTEMIGREQAEQNGELHETSGTDRQRGPGG